MRGMLALAALLALLDQAIKAIIRAVPLHARLWRIDGLVEITHVRNTGAAFSALAGHTALLAALSVALMAAVLWYVQRRMRPTLAARLGVAMLLGGALGNLIDRVALGGVTDYIRLLVIDFPVFNLADKLITTGVGLLMLLTLRGKLEDKGAAETRHDGHDGHE